MTKLTNAMRSAILSHSLAQGRQTRESELKQQERALALRLTLHRYGEDVFRRCRALPDGWLHAHRTIIFSQYSGNNPLGFPSKVVKSQQNSKPWNREYVPYRHVLELDTAVPLPNSFCEVWSREHLGDDLYEEVYDHFADVVALHDEEEQLRAQMRGALLSFTTLEKLRDGWPEAFAHLPQEMLAGTSQANRALPVPRLDDLNARLAAFGKAA